MGSKFISEGYCIYHECRDLLFADKRGRQHHNHNVSYDDAIECYGPFAEVPPPPALTDEDWEQILSMKNEVEQWLF